MADPQQALLTQVKNIEAKTGLTLAQLHAELAQQGGLAKHGEKRSWLMERHGLGHGDANTVVHLQSNPLPVEGAADGGDDPLDAIYAAKKAGLRPLHEALMARVHALGDFEIAPKKAYLSLRRSKQFATIGPATATEIEIGLNCKTLAEHSRLKLIPPGGMCQASTRISAESQIDTTLMGWIEAAYQASA